MAVKVILMGVISRSIALVRGWREGIYGIVDAAILSNRKGHSGG